MVRQTLLILALLVIGVLAIPHFVQAQPVNTPIPKVNSVAYYTSYEGEYRNIGGSDGEIVPVISLNQLPIGNYLVTVTANIGGTFGCSFDPAEFLPNAQPGYWPPILNADIVQFTQAISINEQRDLTLYCQSDPGIDMTEFRVRVAASKVDILNITP